MTIYVILGLKHSPSYILYMNKLHINLMTQLITQMYLYIHIFVCIYNAL